jgi:hypothetical protein
MVIAMLLLEWLWYFSRSSAKSRFKLKLLHSLSRCTYLRIHIYIFSHVIDIFKKINTHRYTYVTTYRNFAGKPAAYLVAHFSINKKYARSRILSVPYEWTRASFVLANNGGNENIIARTTALCQTVALIN